MNGSTINPVLARKRIAAIDSRLERYPEHPQRDHMQSERDRYAAALDAPAGPPPDRLLSRVETLVGAIRKVDQALDGDAKHPNRERLLERRAEYQVSLKNIQEFGREKMPRAPEGVRIEVPADVLEQRNE